MRRSAILSILLASACDDSVETLCGRCDAGDYCVYYGSDVSTEPSTATCEVLPDACTDCACLADALTADPQSGLAWCVEFGCDDVGGIPTVICPGG